MSDIDSLLDLTPKEGESEDTANCRHLKYCPGCPICTQLLEFYARCVFCGEMGHTSELFYDHRTGEYSCEPCEEKKSKAPVS